jgi:hypothetical protein
VGARVLQPGQLCTRRVSLRHAPIPRWRQPSSLLARAGYRCGEVPVSYPRVWTSDAVGLKRTGVPVKYRTPRSKPEVALAARRQTGGEPFLSLVETAH